VASPSPRYRWTILAVGVAAQGALAAVQQGLPALGPLLRDAYDLSLGEVGAVFASVSWGIMATLLFWGWLADRIGERVVICVGLAGASVALVAATAAPSAGWFTAALIAAGAMGGSASAASGRAVMGWFGRSERGFALGIRQMAVPMGGAVAAVALPLFAGLDAAMIALAIACALGAVAAALWIREPPPPPADRPKVDAPPPLRDRRVWRLAIGSGLLVCAQVAIVSFVVLFLHDHRGLSAPSAAAVLAGIQLGGGVARIVAGRMSDREGRRIVPLRRYAAACVVFLLATAVLVDAPLAVLVPILVVTGVLTMSWNGLSFTAAAEMSGRDQAGTALGLQGTVMRFLSSGAAVGFGALVSATSWAAGFAILAAMPLAGWWLMRPLVDEEEGRIRARERRLQAAAAKLPA
jgi:sugar phosphate permease